MYKVSVSWRSLKVREERWEKLDDAMRRAAELRRSFRVRTPDVVYLREGGSRTIVWRGREYSVALSTDSRSSFDELDYWADYLGGGAL